MSERSIFIKELFIKHFGREPKSRKEFYKFLLKQKKLLSTILKGDSDSTGNIDWIDNLATYRNKIGMNKFVELDSFIRYVQYNNVNAIQIDYNEYLKLIRTKDTKVSSNLKSMKIDKLVNYQGSRLAQGLVEIIANAIDASNPNSAIGRFGEGFYQSLKFLDDENDELEVRTKSIDSQNAVKILLRQIGGKVCISSSHGNMLSNGTSVNLSKKLTDEQVLYLKQYISKIFKTNSRVNIYLNDELLNDLSKYNYINKTALDLSNNKSISIQITNDGFIVQDNGIGMNSKIVCEKLLYPTASSKTKINPQGDELFDLVENQTSFFYSIAEKHNNKTLIRLQVGGVMIEEFTQDCMGKISDFTLELPNFTWLPESRNQIIPGREVVVSILKSLEKINNKSESIEEKLMLSEIIGKIINKLKERRTNETEKQYTLQHISKEGFKPILYQVEQTGKSVLPGNKQLIDILGDRETIVYVSEDFVEFDLTKIPGIVQLEKIQGAKTKFYSIPFDDKSSFDYLICRQGVVLNAKYLDKIDHIRVLNTLVNLNIGYEIASEKVFYGRITPETRSIILKTDKDMGVFESHDLVQGSSLDQGNEVKIDNSKETEGFRKKFQERFEKVYNNFVQENNVVPIDSRDLSDYLVRTNIYQNLTTKHIDFFCFFGQKVISTGLYRLLEFDKFIDKFLLFYDQKTNNTFLKLFSFVNNYLANVDTIGDVELKILFRTIDLLEQEPDYVGTLINRMDKKYKQKSIYELFNLGIESNIDSSKKINKKNIQKQEFYKDFFDSLMNNRYENFVKMYGISSFESNLFQNTLNSQDYKSFKDFVKLLEIIILNHNVTIDEIFDTFNKFDVKLFLAKYSVVMNNKDVFNLFEGVIEVSSRYVNFVDMMYDVVVKSNHKLPINTHIGFMSNYLKEELISKNTVKDFVDYLNADPKSRQPNPLFDNMISHLSPKLLKECLNILSKVWTQEASLNVLGSSFTIEGFQNGKDKNHQILLNIFDSLFTIVYSQNENDYKESISYLNFFAYWGDVDVNKFAYFLSYFLTQILLLEKNIIDLNRVVENDFIKKLNQSINLSENKSLSDSCHNLLKSDVILLFSSLLKNVDLDKTITDEEKNKVFEKILHTESFAYLALLETAFNKGNKNKSFICFVDSVGFHDLAKTDLKDVLTEYEIPLEYWDNIRDFGKNISREFYRAISKLYNKYSLMNRFVLYKRDVYPFSLSHLHLGTNFKPNSLFSLLDIYSNAKDGSQNWFVTAAQNDFNIDLHDFFSNTGINSFSVIDENYFKILDMFFQDIFKSFGQNQSLDEFLEFLTHYGNEGLENISIPDKYINVLPILHKYQLNLREVALVIYTINRYCFDSKIKGSNNIGDGQVETNNPIGEIETLFDEKYNDFVKDITFARLGIVMELEYMSKFVPNNANRIFNSYLKKCSDKYGIEFDNDLMFRNQTFGDENKIKTLYERLDLLSKKEIFIRFVLESSNSDSTVSKVFSLLGTIFHDDPIYLSTLANDLNNIIDYVQFESKILSLASSKIKSSDKTKDLTILDEFGLLERYIYTNYTGPFGRDVLTFIRDLSKDQKLSLMMKNVGINVVQLFDEILLKEKGINISDYIPDSRMFIYNSSDLRKHLLTYLQNQNNPFSHFSYSLFDGFYSNQLLKINEYLSAKKNNKDEFIIAKELEVNYGINVEVIESAKYMNFAQYLHEFYKLPKDLVILIKDILKTKDVSIEFELINKLKGYECFMDFINKFTNGKTFNNLQEQYDFLNDVLVDLKNNISTENRLLFQMNELVIKQFQNYLRTISNLSVESKNIINKMIDSHMFALNNFNDFQIVTDQFLKECLVNEQSYILNNKVILREFYFTDESNLQANFTKDNQQLYDFNEIDIGQYWPEIRTVLIGFFNKELFLTKPTVNQFLNKQKFNIHKNLDNAIMSQKIFPQDLLIFVLFLMKGGELLKIKDEKINLLDSDMECKLSEIIYLHRFMNNTFEKIDSLNSLETIFSKLHKSKLDLSLYNREIFSTIEGQDKSSMLWIREVVQNSRDAVLQANKMGSDLEGLIDLEFYSTNNNWTSSVFDEVGMDIFEIFNYLLTPGESSKSGDGSVGMFGQGFYSLAIGAQQIKLKTSKGDGQVIYLDMEPILNDQSSIVDFDIKIQVKSEIFKGTLIERVDESSGIISNLSAMIGVNNIQKYVGNVDDVKINYNGEKINLNSNKTLIDVIQVPTLGELKLYSSKDNIERLTKDNLFINEIPDEFLTDLPDRIINVVRNSCLVIDLPSGISLTKTRNSITDYEKNLAILKPYIYNIILKFVVKSYAKNGLVIPMLPEDYFGLKYYDHFLANYKRLADLININYSLEQEEIDYLKDKAHIAGVLLFIDFEYNGKITNLYSIKQKLLSKKQVESGSSGRFTNVLNEYSDLAEGLNRSMEIADRKILDIEQLIEIGYSKQQIDEFVSFVTKTFSDYVNQKFGCEIQIGFYKRSGGEMRVADYGFVNDKLYLNWNIDHIGLFITELHKEEVKEKIIEVYSHELTHLLETANQFGEQNSKRGSHEKDLQHEASFERLQREMLTQILRRQI